MNTTTRRMLLLATLLAGGAACTDITTVPISTVPGTEVFNDPSAARSFLAKLYGGLALTGQQGPAGNPDIEGIDEGFSNYLRQYWQLEELPTDEAIIAWGDPTLPELNTQQWGPANLFVQAMYYRVFYQVVLANEFLRETTDEKLAARNTSASLRTEIQRYRAEARFLRALSYWHGIDLFGNIPLVTEANPVNSPPPEQATRSQIFDFVVAELNAALPQLAAPRAGEYGRADQGAARMLLAKLYLNSAVYTGTARYAEARAQAEAVINSGAYQLDNRYQELFLADNHTSPEIIFAVPFDGERTRTFGGITYLAHAAVGGSMDAAQHGLNGGWWGLRIRPELYNLYGSGDTRGGIFYTSGQTVNITSVGNFNEGVLAPKYRNVTSTGQPGSNTEFPDTDFPMFRLADAYLMYAEAVLRGGGGTRALALEYVNRVRARLRQHERQHHRRPAHAGLHPGRARARAVLGGAPPHRPGALRALHRGLVHLDVQGRGAGRPGDARAPGPVPDPGVGALGQPEPGPEPGLLRLGSDRRSSPCAAPPPLRRGCTPFWRRWTKAMLRRASRHRLLAEWPGLRRISVRPVPKDVIPSGAASPKPLPHRSRAAPEESTHPAGWLVLRTGPASNSLAIEG